MEEQQLETQERLLLLLHLHVNCQPSAIKTAKKLHMSQYELRT